MAKVSKKLDLEELFLVKAQAALVSTEGPKRVLIYNEDRTVQWEGESPSIHDMIYGMVKKGEIQSPRVYVWAYVKDTIVMFEQVAEDQYQEW